MHTMIYIYITYCDRIYMLSLQKIIIFSFHSLIFHSKIHKHPGTFIEKRWGNSSLKRTYVERVRVRGYIHIKWAGMNKMGEANQKLEVSGEHAFWMTPMSLLQLRFDSNFDTNYSQWPPLKIILNFYEATRIFLIQNESWENSWENEK